MTPEEYWEGDSTLPIFYREKEKIRLEEDFRKSNFDAWLQGRYVALAINATMSKDGKYPEEPLGEAELREKERRAKLTEEELIAEEAERIRQSIMQFKKGR